MKKIIIIACLSFALKANSCLNIFAIDSTGAVHYLEHYFFFEIEFSQEAIAGRMKKLEKEFKNNKYSFQNISDYGSYLLMSGRFGEGLNIFRALSKKYPDVYEIRANTAVAYELNGNVDSALYWEKRAIDMNTGRHHYSEWIHLKILEAKKQLQADPDWCLKNNVTGVIDSIKRYYRVQLHEDGKGGWMLKSFIDQLDERLPFTYGEDKALGKLFLELGDAYMVASAYRSYYCYALAKYFYPGLGTIAKEKMDKILNIYPTGTANVEGRTITLTPGKNNSDKEMLPPDDDEVKRFIKKIINRPDIKNRKIDPIPVEQLIEKI
jgi:tetratricopeptide (TPR) repeat protein